MENLEQNEIVETKPSQLHTVTPLSKYLAMTLFIVLPFLGGWVGYTYAPEKIVEIEKVVIVEKETESKSPTAISSQEIIRNYFPSLNQVNIGDTVGAFEVESIEIDTFRPGIRDGHTALITLTGTTSISGKVIIENSDSEEGKTPRTAYYIAFKPTASEIEKLPLIQNFISKERYASFFVEGLENHPVVLEILTSSDCSLYTDEWCTDLGYTESDEITISISGFNLYRQSLPSGVPYFPVTALIE